MRAPVPIMISCGLVLLQELKGIIPALRNLPEMVAHAPLLYVAWLAISVVVLVVGVASYWRMRRWGPLLLIGAASLNAWISTLSGNGLREKYPLLGPYAAVIVLALILSPSLFYWKHMSWKLLGPLGGSVEKGSAHAHS